jgi:hypothetical protein
MTVESPDGPRVYWQVGDGEKHEIPENANIYCVTPAGKPCMVYGTQTESTHKKP